MTNRIPPRQDFDVSEQVYEWFRSLSTEMQKSDTNDNSDSINSILGVFKGIESEFDELKNQLDTTESLNAKIKHIEEIISLLPEESELSLYKAFSMTFSVVTKEYTGSFAGTSTNVAIDSVNVNSAECLVEVRISVAADSRDISVTSEFTAGTNVLLERVGSDGDIAYVLKVKEYKTNG